MDIIKMAKLYGEDVSLLELSARFAEIEAMTEAEAEAEIRLRETVAKSRGSLSARQRIIADTPQEEWDRMAADMEKSAKRSAAARAAHQRKKAADK